MIILLKISLKTQEIEFVGVGIYRLIMSTNVCVRYLR